MKTAIFNNFLFAAVACIMFAGCEVKDEDLPIPPDTTEPPPVVNTLELLTSSPQLQSDGSTEVTLTAFAKDANNQVMEGINITFASDSGTLVVDNATTTDQGIATATLSTGGDPTNRTITVTATDGTLTSDVTVSVIGSSLQIQGPASLVTGASGTFTAILTDAGGVGIANKTIELSSANGNTLSSTSLTTDINGRVQFTLTGSNSGTDTLTASALPDAQGTHTVSASTNISVSGDSFRFTTPADNSEINLGTTQNVTVLWEKNGTPQAGQTLRFATTRGTLVDVDGNGDISTGVTNASGQVTIGIRSTTAGPGVITATNPEDASAQLSVEFVATTPDKVTVQADPGVVGPNETSTITAIVLDANNNRVKNAIVEFTLADSTGGSLSTASAITDSLGRAQTVYTASSATSADDGVVVTAKVVNPSTVCPVPFDAATAVLCDETAMTVSGRALYITFGTGNSIIEDTADTTYTKNYSLFVSDSSGKGVANTKVNIRMLSSYFIKGRLKLYLEGWGYDDVLIPLVCNSEDDNNDGVITDSENNGILDPGEDLNGDGELTPGNVAIVAPGTVTTDANGIASFAITYPQNYAMWVIGRITASASVAGSESRSSGGFYFPASADDLKPDVSPPNGTSPFGTDVTNPTGCFNFN